jgi:K+-transporting ATPase ATPase C chain
MMRLPGWISQHWAAVRAVLVLTVITGLVYPFAILGIAQIPGLRDKANGSVVEVNGKPVGSTLIGQLFTDADGNADPRYFQSRPSAAGDGYDLDATAASNLGPESIEDTLGDPALDADSEEGDGSKQALLSQVCARSVAVGELEGVDGSRPFCTDDGVGAVLRVFYSDGLTGKVTRAVSVNERCPATPFLADYEGAKVECGQFGEDYSGGVLTPVRGGAPAEPAVPADAVAASASGLDPHISVAYAELQAPRVVARELDLHAVRIAQVDRIHEAAIALEKLDAALPQAVGNGLERRARDVERDVLDAADLARRVANGVLTRFVREHRQQPPVARIEIEVVLVGLAEVRLLEDERHSEQSLPERDRALLRRSNDRDVMQPLHLDRLHDRLPGPRRCPVTSRRLARTDPSESSPGQASTAADRHPGG